MGCPQGLETLQSSVPKFLLSILRPLGSGANGTAAPRDLLNFFVDACTPCSCSYMGTHCWPPHYHDQGRRAELQVSHLF